MVFLPTWSVELHSRLHKCPHSGSVPSIRCFFCTKMPTTTKWRKRQKKVGNFHIIPNIDVFRGRVVFVSGSANLSAFWFREKSPSKKSIFFNEINDVKQKSNKKRKLWRVLHATSHCPLFFSIWHLWFKSCIFSLSIQKKTPYIGRSPEQTFKKNGKFVGRSPWQICKTSWKIYPNPSTPRPNPRDQQSTTDAQVTLPKGRRICRVCVVCVVTVVVTVTVTVLLFQEPGAERMCPAWMELGGLKTPRLRRDFFSMRFLET